MAGFGRKLQKATVNGAKLYIAPAQGSYTVGSNLVLTIREDSHAVAVNAVQANLTYPSGLLQWQSTNVSGAAFTTAIQNTGGSGSVTFGAALLGSSVTGDQLVATVTFTVLAAGTAPITFATGSSIASEAEATDICRIKQGASYTLN